jgi:hypothetical protein
MRSSPTCLRTLMGGTGAQAQEGHSRRESPRLARDFARPPDKQSDARGPRRGRKVCPECARTMRVDTGDTRTVEGGIDAELPGMPTDCPDAAQWSPPGRATQNLVPFGAWGFDSPSRHQQIHALHGRRSPRWRRSPLATSRCRSEALPLVFVRTRPGRTRPNDAFSPWWPPRIGVES